MAAPVVRLPEFPPREVPLRHRLGAALGNGALGAVMIGIAAAIDAATPPDPFPRLLAWFVRLGGLSFVGFGVAQAVRRAARPRRTTRDGSPAAGLRAWTGDLVHSMTIDVLFIALCVAGLWLDLASGGRFLPWSLLPAIFAVWPAVRIGLYLAGRKFPEAIWLSADALAHETEWGSERVRLDQVTGIVCAPAEDAVVVLTDGQPQRTPCPRPWRHRLPETEGMVLLTRGYGHRPEDVAGWLADAAGLSGTVTIDHPRR